MKRSQFFRAAGSALLILMTALSSLFYWGSGRSAAQGAGPLIREIRAMQPNETGITQPLGLVFASRLGDFYTLEGKTWNRASGLSELLALTPLQGQAGTARIAAAIDNPINMVFDDPGGRLLILRERAGQLVMVGSDSSGAVNPAQVSQLAIRGWGLKDPQGMAVDPASGDLFILDATGPALLHIRREPGGDFSTSNTSRVDLSAAGISSPRGLALDPSTGHLHILSPAQNTLFELSLQGKVLSGRDVSQLHLNEVGGMVFAPSGDQTDDPNRTSLYLADSTTVSGPSGSQTTGQVTEFSFLPAATLPPGTSMLPATLVRTFDTSSWNHPSPDPSGMDYWPATGQLLISDSEIEEFVGTNPPAYWDGYNVFLSTLGGSLAGNCTTYTSGSVTLTYNNFSDEPTGVGINPNNNHIFFSNDGANSRVFELSPGTDKAYCTPDDIVTRVRVGNKYGATDAEDVAYGNNTLFESDGINGEVFVFPLGADGLFGTADDGPVTHWDTSALGFDDLEGIGYNADRGTLFIVSTQGDQNYLGEVTTSGTLLYVYDLSLMGTMGNIRSDVVYAPSSQNPNVKSIYICSRGIDNNSDRLENDGMVWEINIGTPPTPTPTLTRTPGPSPTPTFTATASSTPVLPDLIFADSFESGDFSAWSSSQTDAGDLAVTANAGIAGGKGMRALINDTNLIYVTDNGPQSETHYRARFYFDPNSITMANGDMHNIFNGLEGTTTTVVRVQFRSSSGQYQVKAGAMDNTGAWLVTSWFAISDAPHSLEFNWQAATGTGSKDGVLTFWIDGVQMDSLTGIDNDTRRVDIARLGAITGLDAGTSGTEYFDGFVSHRFTYIGPVATSTPTPGPSPTPTFTPTASLTPTPTSTSNLPDLIFSDGFESGSFSAWSASQTDLGDLAVTSNAGIAGGLGMRALLNDTHAIYVTDNSPQSEAHYRARFYFDPNTITMASGDLHNIFDGQTSAATSVLRMQFRYFSGNYQVRAGALDNASTWLVTSWFSITDAPHSLEVNWQAATAPGANDGALSLWIDGSLMPEVTGINNDTRRIDTVRLGAITGIDVGTSGTEYFDGFISHRFTYIGP